MQRRIWFSIGIAGTLSLGMLAPYTHASGVFDWMNPNKWFNGRDYDRDYRYRYYGYPGYGYPNYAYPGWNGYYPGAYGYPTVGYPAYGYPVQIPQTNATQPPAPPTPQ
ncbi:hypothetical protein TI04_05495 [Achromatium sp. WMS2]|nr:hypothetical protein TI04_05495 [Achromatium sp. WMS2]